MSEQIKYTNDALEKLYDQNTRQYYSRDFITHELIIEPSIGTFLLLYSGAISRKRAGQLEKQLRSNEYFWKDYPVSSVPHHSSFFDEERYWQGPTWINTNWMIIEGLRRYGFNDTADYLKERTIELIRNNGIYEYYSAIDGHGLGAHDFSWTAALMLDLLNT